MMRVDEGRDRPSQIGKTMPRVQESYQQEKTTRIVSRNDSANSTFQELRCRLNQLELWRELAVRPTEDECSKDDLDLLQKELDDCEELQRRCISVRSIMNDNLPSEPKVRDHDLAPRESSIPEAGLGLYFEPLNANKVIQSGETICYYWGHIHNFHSAKLVVDQTYLMLVQGDILVDPGPLSHVKARYINDPLKEDFVNGKFVPENFRSAVVATRTIHHGEELFVSYGEAYWANQNIVGRRKM